VKKENQCIEKGERREERKQRERRKEKNAIKEPRKEDKINCRKETMKMEGEEKKRKTTSATICFDSPSCSDNVTQTKVTSTSRCASVPSYNKRQIVVRVSHFHFTNKLRYHSRGLVDCICDIAQWPLRTSVLAWQTMNTRSFVARQNYS